MEEIPSSLSAEDFEFLEHLLLSSDGLNEEEIVKQALEIHDLIDNHLYHSEKDSESLYYENEIYYKRTNSPVLRSRARLFSSDNSSSVPPHCQEEISWEEASGKR